jgi:predicted Rossmann fold nucleotide-binding protein DprA/Smf involved in DNA uptake
MAVESWESRGLWVMSRYDERYPARLRNLGPLAPPILYGAGDPQLLTVPNRALAVVGSRHVDEEALDLARKVARACARETVALVSGGARGVDSQAMGAALEAGGTVIGVLAENLARAAVSTDNREALVDERLVLISPYDPQAPFNIGNAMGRNKYVYALADAALVVHTSTGSGGTWAGATEALMRGEKPVFVWLGENPEEGNLRLLEKGALALPEEALEDLSGWLVRVIADKHEDVAAAGGDGSAMAQGTLF